MSRTTTSALLALALFTGCGATGYHSYGFTGGYWEEHVDGNVYNVFFEGNEFTSESVCMANARRRAEEFCRSKGFSGYQELESEVAVNEVHHGVVTNVITTARVMIECIGGAPPEPEPEPPAESPEDRTDFLDPILDILDAEEQEGKR